MMTLGTPTDMYSMIGICPESILASEVGFALRNVADASDAEVMALQYELVQFLSEDLLELPKQNNEGIVLHSGSEANEVALLLAKRATGKSTVMVSNLSHSSIPSSSKKLDMEVMCVEVDRPGFQVGAEILNDVLKKHGKDIALLNITYGTTKLGTRQDFQINAETASLLRQHDIWVHVDAAYGGFMLSLLDDEAPAWKTLPTLRSVTIDTHKFVGALGCGVLLLPDYNDKKHVGAEVVYFEGNASALGTTRSAYPLATALATIRHFGNSGLTRLAEECHSKAVKLGEDIECLGLNLFLPITTGVVPIQLSGMEDIKYFKASLSQEGYKVSPIIIPFAKESSYGIRVVVTPKKEMVQSALSAFVKALEKVVL